MAQKILLIEDNHDNSQLVRFLLERVGCEVVTAIDGVTGLRLAGEEMPDLVLLDLSIPEMDGWTVAEELKANAATENIPLVALTAHALPSDRKRAMAAGCDGYIVKPIDVPNFAEEVTAFIKA